MKVMALMYRIPAYGSIFILLVLFRFELADNYVFFLTSSYYHKHLFILIEPQKRKYSSEVSLSPILEILFLNAASTFPFSC